VATARLVYGDEWGGKKAKKESQRRELAISGPQKPGGRGGQDTGGVKTRQCHPWKRKNKEKQEKGGGGGVACKSKPGRKAVFCGTKRGGGERKENRKNVPK